MDEGFNREVFLAVVKFVGGSFRNWLEGWSVVKLGFGVR